MTIRPTAPPISPFALAARDSQLRCLRRVNRLGLAGAVIEGVLSSSAEFVAVIDGDLQHDESILPRMFAGFLSTAAPIWRSAPASSEEAAERGLSPARQRSERRRRLFLQAHFGLSASPIR